MKNASKAIFVFTISVAGSLEVMRRQQFAVFESTAQYEAIDRETRTPAAIRKVFDYSHLIGNAFQNAVHNHLVSESKVVQSSDGPGVQLGHFVVKNAVGEKVFACDQFDTVELSFYAEGILESGSQPVMVVETPCRFSQNVNQIDPVWIPVKQLVNDRPGNMDLSINTMPQPLRLQFKDMPPFWPNKWVMSKIRLYNKSNETLNLTLDVESKTAAKQVAIYFNPTEKR